MVVYCLVFSLHFDGNLIYIRVSLLLLSPLFSVDLFNVYNQISEKLYVVLSWFTQSVCGFILVYTICVLFFLVYTIRLWFYSGLHSLCVVFSGFSNLYVVLSRFTQSVCSSILVYTIYVWFYLGLHSLYVVQSWFTQSVCGFPCVWFYLCLQNLHNC